MQIIVRRDTFTPKSTGGILIVDDEIAGYTLEPPKLDPPTKPRAIPPGSYRVIVAWSPKHNRFLPLVENVPDFEGVEIHIGNWPQDTLGCLLVGAKRGPDEVMQSTAEFGGLFEKINEAFKAGEEITISYVEFPPEVAA